MSNSEPILKRLDDWSNPFVCILVNNNDLASHGSNLISYGHKKALQFLGPVAGADNQREQSLDRCMYNSSCASVLGRRGHRTKKAAP